MTVKFNKYLLNISVFIILLLFHAFLSSITTKAEETINLSFINQEDNISISISGDKNIPVSVGIIVLEFSDSIEIKNITKCSQETIIETNEENKKITLIFLNENGINTSSNGTAIFQFTVKKNSFGNIFLSGNSFVDNEGNKLNLRYKDNSITINDNTVTTSHDESKINTLTNSSNENSSSTGGNINSQSQSKISNNVSNYSSYKNENSSDDNLNIEENNSGILNINSSGSSYNGFFAGVGITLLIFIIIFISYKVGKSSGKDK